MRREIRSASRQMQTFNQHNLICQFEANGTDVLYLHVLDLNVEGLKFGRGF